MAHPLRGDGLVGRVHELEQLVTLIDGARRGEGAALVIIGEPGAGKSAMAQAAVATAEHRGLTVRFGRCLQLEIERPFAALYDALGAPTVGPDVSVSRTVLEAGALAATRFLLGERLIEQIELLAGHTPTLLVVEDLHWSDSSTLQLVRLIAERAGDLPLALLATTRPTRAGTDVHRLVGSTDVLAQMSLAPLDADEVRELVARTAGGPPGARLSLALERARGNPLLVLAAVEALERAGALGHEEGMVELTGDAGELQPGAAITSRLGEVETEVLHMLQPAAVLGHRVSPTVLAEMLGRRAADLLALLDRACALGILVPDDDGYAFRHELHRSAVLATVTVGMRNALHLDAARALVATGAPAIEVAEHFARGASAGNRDAVDWLQRAANDLVYHAPGTALRLLDVALRLSGTTPTSDLLLARVRALSGTGRTAETEALARSLLREGLDVATEAQLHRELGFAYFVQGRSAECVAEGEQYCKLITDPRQQGRIQAELAFARFVDLDHDGAREAAVRAVQEGQRFGDLAAQVGGGGVLCWLDEFANRFEPALGRARDITMLAEQPHAIDANLYQPWFIAALVHLESDHLDELAHDARRGREVALQTGFAWSLPGYDAMAAYGLHRSGDHDDALAVASSTLGYLEGVDGFGVALWCHAFLAQIAIHRGDEAGALENLAVADENLTTGRAQFGFEQSMIAKARLAERHGDAAAAFQVYADTWDIYGGIGVLAGRQALGADLVRLACGAGDDQRAAEVVACLEEGAATSRLPAFRAFAQLARAWRANDADAARAAADLMATTPRRPTTAAFLFDASKLLRSAGRVSEADACATSASELYASCGADADAAIVAATIAGRAPRRRNRPRFGFDALTPTEARVVGLIADGLSNRDIATQLYVSRRTVETHVSMAYRKLEVSSRVELAKLVLSRR